MTALIYLFIYLLNAAVKKISAYAAFNGRVKGDEVTEKTRKVQSWPHLRH